MENAEHQKMAEMVKKETKLVLSRLQELESLADTTLHDQLPSVWTLSREKNGQGLVSLRKELNGLLEKHHQKIEEN